MKRVPTTCLLALLALPAAAQAQDGLSGSYRPAGEEAAEQDRPDGGLRVEAAGDHWTGWFNGAPRRLEPVSAADAAAMFPGVPERAHLQCAAAAALLLCRVDRGTRFPASSFTSTTGYFSIVADGSAFELVRDEPQVPPGR